MRRSKAAGRIRTRLMPEVKMLRQGLLACGGAPGQTPPGHGSGPCARGPRSPPRQSRGRSAPTRARTRALPAPARPAPREPLSRRRRAAPHAPRHWRSLRRASAHRAALARRAGRAEQSRARGHPVAGLQRRAQQLAGDRRAHDAQRTAPALARAAPVQPLGYYLASPRRSPSNWRRCTGVRCKRFSGPPRSSLRSC